MIVYGGLDKHNNYLNDVFEFFYSGEKWTWR